MCDDDGEDVVVVVVIVVVVMVVVVVVGIEVVVELWKMVNLGVFTLFSLHYCLW